MLPAAQPPPPPGAPPEPPPLSQYPSVPLPASTSSPVAAAVSATAPAPAPAAASGRRVAGGGGLEIVTRVVTTYPNGSMRINQYTFLCHLGAGAYGEVVLARTEMTGALVVRLRAALCCLRSHRHAPQPPPPGAASFPHPPGSPRQAVKCFSKARLLKKRDIVGGGGGSGMRVVTALDKVQSEILTMQKLAPHPNTVGLQAVLSESAADDLFLGASPLRPRADRLRLPPPTARSSAASLLRSCCCCSPAVRRRRPADGVRAVGRGVPL